MAVSIQERKRKDDTVFRLRIRIKGYPCFSATFATHEDCIDWLDLYYDRYLADPKKFVKDHRKYAVYMNRKNIHMDENGMIQPKLRL